MQIVEWALNKMGSNLGELEAGINFGVFVSVVILSILMVRAFWVWFNLENSLKDAAPDRDPKAEKQIKKRHLQKWMKGNVVKQRIYTIAKNAEQLGKTDVETLSGITAQSFMKWDIVFNVITASLVTVGLLGTFLGLTQTLGGLFSGVGLESLENFSSKVSQALNGIEFAFRTSLYGLMGALIISLFHAGKKFMERVLLKELDRLTVEYLLPLFQPENVYADFRLVAKELRKILSEIRSSAKTFTTVADKLEFDQERFEHTIQVFHSAADSLTQRENLIQSAMNQIENLQKDLRGAMREQGETLNHYLSGINALSGQVARLSSAIGHGQKDMQNILSAFNNTLHKWSGNLERIDASHQNNADKYRRLLEELNSLTDFLKERVEQIVRNSEKAVLELDGKIISGFDAMGDRLEGVAKAIGDSSRVVTDKLEEAVRSDLQAIHKEVVELTKTFETSIALIAEKLETDSAVKMADSVERIHSGFADLRKAIRGLASGLQQQMVTLTERIREEKKAPAVKDSRDGANGNGHNLPVVTPFPPKPKGIVAGLYEKMRARFTNWPNKN